MVKWIAMLLFLFGAAGGGLYYRHWKGEKDKKARIEKQLERQRLLGAGRSEAQQLVAKLEADLQLAQGEGKATAEEIAKLKADLEAAKTAAAAAPAVPAVPAAGDGGAPTELAAGDGGAAMAPAPAPAPATP